MAEQLVKDAMVVTLIGGKVTVQGLVHREGGVGLGPVVEVEKPANFDVWFKEANRIMRNEAAVPAEEKKAPEDSKSKARTVKDK